MEKNIRGFLKNFFEYNFLILLWMSTSLLIWNLNITVSTALKYCYKWALNKKLKLMVGTMKLFLWSPGLRIVFSKIYKTLPLPLPPCILNVRSLRCKLWCLIIASTKLMQYLNAMPCFCKKNFNWNINYCYCNFLCLSFPFSKYS